MKAIAKAAQDGELSRLRELIRSPVDINQAWCMTPGDEESLLQEIVSYLSCERSPHRVETVRFFLDRGADPDFLAAKGGGALLPPMLNGDLDMLCLLLEAGADPNLPAGWNDKGTFYDWAKLDYQIEGFHGGGWHCPEEPEDRAMSEDAWIEWHDSMAIKYQRPRPDTLRLLREFGAKSRSEMSGGC